MLYPYTDNYLDDPTIPQVAKRSFNQRFQQRLNGVEIVLENQFEERISRLVGMIENQWDRAAHPTVYASLLAIHTAQARSLKLNQPAASPFEVDILGISFGKGGTSVLADGYLVAGSLTPEQARYLFGYGAFTQLMDDLEDTIADISTGRMTIFSQTAPHWTLDRLTNRLFHFGRKILADLDAFQYDVRQPLEEVISLSIDPIMIDIVGRCRRYYSQAYLAAMEKYSPYRFTALKRLRKKLYRKKITFDTLVTVLQM
jgi:hypothetical protein